MKETIYAIIAAIIVFSIVGGLLVGAASSFKRCDPPFSRRYQYVVPTSMLSCPAIRWIRELEPIYEE